MPIPNNTHVKSEHLLSASPRSAAKTQMYFSVVLPRPYTLRSEWSLLLFSSSVSTLFYLLRPDQSPLNLKRICFLSPTEYLMRRVVVGANHFDCIDSTFIRFVQTSRHFTFQCITSAVVVNLFRPQTVRSERSLLRLSAGGKVFPCTLLLDTKFDLVSAAISTGRMH